MFTNTGAGIVITDMDNTDVINDGVWKLFCIITPLRRSFGDKGFCDRQIRIDNAVYPWLDVRNFLFCERMIKMIIALWFLRIYMGRKASPAVIQSHHRLVEDVLDWMHLPVKLSLQCVRFLYSSITHLKKHLSAQDGVALRLKILTYSRVGPNYIQGQKVF